jgi:subtilisin family serine protease
MRSTLFRLVSAAVLVMMLVTTVSAHSTPDEATSIYIVRLEDAPLAGYRGGIAGLEPTSPRVTGAPKLDATSPASIAYRDYLAEQQAQLIAAMEQSFGHQVEVVFQYDAAYNGMAVRLTAREAADLVTFPGVVDVQPDFVLYPTTDYGPTWIGAPGIWDGSDVPGGVGTKGEGVIVGILDTGLNMDHPSFAATGPSDGYVHINPYGPGNYVGLCLDDPGTWVCNDKLIGYYIYTGEDHEDEEGHGSHTASTAAGNVLDAGYVDLTPYDYSPAISGVAPHANIIGYDVCNDTGGCPGSGSIAATNQAVLDGVDVINFSIGGGTSNPWTDTGSLAFLYAAEAGIVPVTSAGNSGPGASTIGSPADAPWMVSVGSNTHNRAGSNSLIDMTGGDTPPPADMDGKGFSEGYGPAPIVYAGDYGDALCLDEFTPGTFPNGEIVVCDRGTNARVAKGWNVMQGGAGGYILANASASQTLNGDVHHLPAVHITYDDGVDLKAWLASGSDHMATIEGTTLSTDPANGDIMAGSSSRGPLINTAEDVIKPDLSAPGVDILAAIRSLPPDAEDPTTEYGIKSGTSMSSPHTAGAAALLRALYPGWSPAQIKSALMTTAWTATVLKEDGMTPADPFDIGGGRVDLSMAAKVGMVLDVTTAEFEDANPALGGEPRALNLPSMGDADCAGICSWTRVVSSTLDTTESWTVSTSAAPGMNLTVTPDSFDLAPAATQTITVTADVLGAPVGEWVFGKVLLTPDSPSVAEAHLPVAVQMTAQPPVISVEPSSLESLQSPDVVVTEPLTITNLGETPLDWMIYEDAGLPGGAPELVDWFEDFDSYPTGQDLHGVGGWKGWFNDPAATAFTTDVQAHSAPNSVDIATTSDLVHEYAGYDTSTWRYTAWQYVPNDFSGESYFLLLNQYDDSGAPLNWSTQVHFESTQDLVIADGAGAGQTLPLIRGQWVEIRVEINLDTDWQQFYYDDQLLFEGSWTEGMSGGGILNIGSVDLFANGASSVYYDDLSLVSTIPGVCDSVNDIPWVSVSPESGTTEGGESSPVDVAFDSIGLDLGVYTGTLCIDSNDPATPLVIVPLTMTVDCFEVTTATISGPEEVLPGEVATYTVTWEPDDATPPINIEWSNGMTTTEAAYSWPEPGDYTVVVTATNCDGAVVTDTFDVTVIAPCVEVISATISGPEALLVGEMGTFSVTLEPPDATPPIDILWSNGMTGTSTTYSWDEPGTYTVVVTATNCEGAALATGTLEVAVTQPMHYVYLPIVVKDQ